MRRRLVVMRRRGIPFREAWPRAYSEVDEMLYPLSQKEAIERRAWLEALDWAEPTFERAYAGEDVPLIGDLEAILHL